MTATPPTPTVAAPCSQPAPGPGEPRSPRARHRARARSRRAALLDRLLRQLGRPSPQQLDRLAGVVALALRPSDPSIERLPPLCRLNEIRLVALRHRWRDGRPALPLTVHRFDLDPITGLIHAARVAEHDLAAEVHRVSSSSLPRARPLHAANNPSLAALAAAMLHQARDCDPGELPDALIRPPEFLYAFGELPEPAPLAFEDNPLVRELAVDLACDTDEVWRRLQAHVVVHRGGRLAEWPRHRRRPEPHELPPGARLYATWPSVLFARDPGHRHDSHPVDGSPRPPDGAIGEELPASWFLYRGAALPRAQVPELVLVRPPAAAGRVVPNPAWSALRWLGVTRGGSPRAFGRKRQAAWPGRLAALAARDPQLRDRLGLWTFHLATALGLPASRQDVDRMLHEPATPALAPGLPDVQLARPGIGDGRRPGWRGAGFELDLVGPG